MIVEAMAEKAMRDKGRNERSLVSPRKSKLTGYQCGVKVKENENWEKIGRQECKELFFCRRNPKLVGHVKSQLKSESSRRGS